MVNPCCNVPEGDVVEPRSPERGGEGAEPPPPDNRPRRPEAPLRRAHDQAGPSSVQGPSTRGVPRSGPSSRGAQGPSTRGAVQAGRSSGGAQGPSTHAAAQSGPSSVQGPSTRGVPRSGPSSRGAEDPSTDQAGLSSGGARRPPTHGAAQEAPPSRAFRAGKRRQGPHIPTIPAPVIPSVAQPAGASGSGHGHGHVEPAGDLPQWDEAGPTVEDLRDPTNELINYGHRSWPVNNVEDIISGMMSFMFPGLRPAKRWKNDAALAPRLRRICSEFNQYGLPQTVHADHTHETLEPQEGVLNPSWRCWCWRNLLGEYWFNDTDATILARLGNEWANAQDLLNHLLKRLITAMTSTYRETPDYRANNPTNVPSRLIDKWPLENLLILEKMTATRGKGLYSDLGTSDQKLVGELTGVPLKGVFKRVGQNKKNIRDGSFQELTPQQRHQSKISRLVLSPRERLYWEEYLLPNRMMDPKFTWSKISTQILDHYRRNIHEVGPDDPDVEPKVRIFTELWFSNKRIAKGARMRQEAYGFYNIIARANGGEPFNLPNPQDNITVWIRQACEQTLEKRRKEVEELLAGQRPASDEEVIEELTMAQEAELAEQEEEAGGGEQQFWGGEFEQEAWSGEQEAGDREQVAEERAEVEEGAVDGSPGPRVRTPSDHGSPQGVPRGGGEEVLEQPQDGMQQSLLQTLVDLGSSGDEAVTDYFDMLMYEEGSPYRRAIAIQATSPSGSPQPPLAGVPGFPDIELVLPDLELTFEFPTIELQDDIEQELGPAAAEPVLAPAPALALTPTPTPTQAGPHIGRGKRIAEEEPGDEEDARRAKRPRPVSGPGGSSLGPRSPPHGDVGSPGPGPQHLPLGDPDFVGSVERDPQERRVVRRLPFDEAIGFALPRAAWPPNFVTAPSLPEWGPDEPRLDQLLDPTHNLVNYGHRVWPIESPEFLLSGMMAFIWPGARPQHTYRNDLQNLERMRRLLLEFNQYGLPQTVHADLGHETLNPPEGVLNPSWRCKCWRRLLGDNWFNDTDSSIIHRLGPAWVDEQGLLIHLLKRLITAMVNHYFRQTQEIFYQRNPDPYLRNLKVKVYRWSLEQIQLYDKMLEIRGENKQYGRNWSLQQEDRELVAQLTGMPEEAVVKRLHNLFSHRKKYVQTRLKQQKEQEALDALLVGRRDFNTEEMLFWDEYLLPRRLRNPHFNFENVTADIKEQFRCNKARYPHDPHLQFKIQAYVYNYVQNQQKRRGYKQRMAAYELYNRIANENDAPPFNGRAPRENNDEWIDRACNRVLELYRKAEADIRDGRRAANDAEMRDTAQIAQDMEEPGGDEEQVQLDEEGAPVEGSRSPRARSPNRAPSPDAFQRIDELQLDPIPQPGPGTPYFDDLLRQMDIALGQHPTGYLPPSASPTDPNDYSGFMAYEFDSLMSQLNMDTGQPAPAAALGSTSGSSSGFLLPDFTNVQVPHTSPESAAAGAFEASGSAPGSSTGFLETEGWFNQTSPQSQGLRLSDFLDLDVQVPHDPTSPQSQGLRLSDFTNVQVSRDPTSPQSQGLRLSDFLDLDVQVPHDPTSPQSQGLRLSDFTNVQVPRDPTSPQSQGLRLSDFPDLDVQVPHDPTSPQSQGLRLSDFSNVQVPHDQTSPQSQGLRLPDFTNVQVPHDQTSPQSQNLPASAPSDGYLASGSDPVSSTGRPASTPSAGYLASGSDTASSTRRPASTPSSGYLPSGSSPDTGVQIRRAPRPAVRLQPPIPENLFSGARPAPPAPRRTPGSSGSDPLASSSSGSDPLASSSSGSDPLATSSSGAGSSRAPGSTPVSSRRRVPEYRLAEVPRRRGLQFFNALSIRASRAQGFGPHAGTSQGRSREQVTGARVQVSAATSSGQAQAAASSPFGQFSIPDFTQAAAVHADLFPPREAQGHAGEGSRGEAEARSPDRSPTGAQRTPGSSQSQARTRSRAQTPESGSDARNIHRGAASEAHGTSGSGSDARSIQSEGRRIIEGSQSERGAQGPAIVVQGMTVQGEQQAKPQPMDVDVPETQRARSKSPPAAGKSPPHR